MLPKTPPTIAPTLLFFCGPLVGLLVGLLDGTTAGGVVKVGLGATLDTATLEVIRTTAEDSGKSDERCGVNGRLDTATRRMYALTASCAIEGLNALVVYTVI
jgi:hypothetical protein